MTFLSLSILCSSFINWIFRRFKQAKINSLHAIVINYLTCSVVGQSLGKTFIFSSNQQQEPYFLFTLLLGFLFVGIFFSMAKTTEYFGVASNAVSSKMAFIFPALFFFFWLDEQISVTKWVGMALAILAVIAINLPKGKTVRSESPIYFPILVFFGSGLIDGCMKWIDITYLKGNSPLMATTTIFTGAFIVGVIVLLFRKEWKIKGKDWLAGILLGIPNYFSIYFLILALQELTSAGTGAIFAVNNVGVILVSTIGSIFFFKDHLNKTQTIGLALSVLSITLITLAV